MPITKKTHYIPCFWTAFWNSDYYHFENIRRTQSPRKQIVKSLNYSANKIITTKTEKVFFEHGMGLSDITYNSIIDFANRNNESCFNDIINLSPDSYSDLVIDFENFFTTMEDLVKEQLVNIIVKNEINTISEKAYIASFISDLIVRNYKNFDNLSLIYEKMNKPKFELFWNLRNDFSNPVVHQQLIIPIVASEWILYRTSCFKFPLGDQPVLSNKRNILIALSPTLLLKVNLKKKVSPKKICKNKKGVNYFVYREFMQRTISDSFREIIFNDEDLLNSWKETRVYKEKIAKMNLKKNEC